MRVRAYVSRCLCVCDGVALCVYMFPCVLHQHAAFFSDSSHFSRSRVRVILVIPPALANYASRAAGWVVANANHPTAFWLKKGSIIFRAFCSFQLHMFSWREAKPENSACLCLYVCVCVCVFSVSLCCIITRCVFFGYCPLMLSVGWS